AGGRAVRGGPAPGGGPARAAQGGGPDPGRGARETCPGGAGAFRLEGGGRPAGGAGQGGAGGAGQAGGRGGAGTAPEAGCPLREVFYPRRPSQPEVPALRAGKDGSGGVTCRTHLIPLSRLPPS